MLFRYITSPKGVLLGLCFLGVAIVKGWSEIPFWFSTVPGEAQVVRVENVTETRRPQHGGGDAYQKVWFNYESSDGTHYQGYDIAGWNDYRAGNTIEIHWLSGRPEKVRIKGNRSASLWNISLLLAGLCFVWRPVLWPFQALGIVTISAHKKQEP